MSEEDLQKLWDIVEAKLTERAGSALKIASYLEYQIDLLTEVVKDLSGLVDTTKLSQDAQTRLALVDELRSVSSVDFSNLSSPYEAFKIPNTAIIKQTISEVRQQYLDVVLRAQGLVK